MNKNNNKKILIVEDDPGIVDAMKLALEINDYHTSAIPDGITLDDIKKDRPELILLDIWIPGMDAPEFCKQLKKDSETESIPVIMVSANNDLRNIAKESLADDYLEKPFELDDLILKVDRHINGIN